MQVGLSMHTYTHAVILTSLSTSIHNMNNLTYLILINEYKENNKI